MLATRWGISFFLITIFQTWNPRKYREKEKKIERKHVLIVWRESWKFKKKMKRKQEKNNQNQSQHKCSIPVIIIVKKNDNKLIEEICFQSYCNISVYTEGLKSQMGIKAHSETLPSTATVHSNSCHKIHSCIIVTEKLQH